MRTHSDIAGGLEMADRLHRLTGASFNTCRSWAQRNSIPAEHWASIAEAGIASLEELADAAASRRANSASEGIAA